MHEQSTTLRGRDWNRLLYSIAEGTCVLMLGPDAACAPEAAGESLMMRFEALLGDADELSPDGLQRVAQAFMRTTGDPRDLWFEVESFYAAYAQATTDMHRNLASLPFSLCVQTTPDRLMRNAFDERTDKEPVEAYCHLREGIGVVGASSGKHLVEPDPDNPLVFGLHGHAIDGESVVLTETDLLDFLVRLARDRSMLPQFLYNRFAAEQTTFLFMGFGFQSWYQRLMLHLLRGKSVGSGRLMSSLALEGEHFFPKEGPPTSGSSSIHIVACPSTPGPPPFD